MKKLIYASAIACLTLPALAQAHDKDGQVSDENVVVHNLKGFDRLDVSGVYTLHVKIGDDFFVQTSGRDKDVKGMIVKVQGDSLILGHEKDRSKKGNNKSIDLVMTVPSIRALDVSGVVTGQIDGMDEDRIDIDIQGVTSLEISGRCGELNVDVQGVGDMDASDLKCENVNADLEGVGAMSVYASESVHANASGIGSLDVYGKPTSVKKSDHFLNKVKIH